MSRLLFLEKYNLVEVRRNLIQLQKYLIMILTHKYEHFVQFTVDILDVFVRKGVNTAFWELGRSRRFCNPG